MSAPTRWLLMVILVQPWILTFGFARLQQNAPAILRALSRFGAPLHELTTEDLCHDDTIFQIGVAPRRIDIITGVSGLEFDAAWQHAEEVEIEGLSIRIPSLDDLIKNKEASGRTKDLADAEALKRLN